MKDRVREAVETANGALVLFVTAGYPRVDATPAVLAALDAGGADVIELGLPFSDSLADGPTVQDSYHHAIEGGMTLDRALRDLAEVAPDLRAPVVLMGSYNPILRFGPARFLKRAARSGAAGVLIPDLLPEDAAELRRAARAAGIAPVPLAAANSDPARYPTIVRGAGGFLYQMARTGTTGVRAGRLPPELRAQVAAARVATDLPVCLGFGISTRAQVREAQRIADGAVVGSALLQEIAGARSAAAAARKAKALARELSGTKGGRR